MPRALKISAPLIAAVLSVGAAAARAQTADLHFAVDATQTGRLDFYLRGPANAPAVVAERSGGVVRPLRTAVLDARGDAVLYDGARWRCTPRDREFVALARSPTGAPLSAAFEVLTPSCRDRLAIRLPRHVDPGARAVVTVRDRWGIGDLPLRACLRRPGRRTRCRGLELRPGVTSSKLAFRPHRRGLWRVELSAPGLREGRTLAVGVPAPRRHRALPTILATGDSMMQGLDELLSDRLARRARVIGQVSVGTGISKPAAIGWVRRARRQADRLHPRATVVFVGANDGYDMRTPAGASVICCDEAWSAEYARRARLMMRAYLRGGRGRVIWLTLPAPASPLRAPAWLAEDAAALRAAAGLNRVQVVRLDLLFTPGWRYRATMRSGGRRVRVREGDGVHLSIAGARIAAGPVIDALRDAGVVR